MAKKLTIEAGQIFREQGQGFLGNRAIDWEVVGTFDGADGLTYARLVGRHHLRESKTLSSVVLGDPRRFALVGRAGDSAAA
jgi:hypothetical protein